VPGQKTFVTQKDSKVYPLIHTAPGFSRPRSSRSLNRTQVKGRQVRMDIMSVFKMFNKIKIAGKNRLNYFFFMIEYGRIV
jgi:hypothetical protein